MSFQFPWQVSLRITVSNSALQSFCGGALISEFFVLTAASCLRNVVSIQVDLGSILFSQPLISQHTTNFLIHQQYDPNFNINDVAIIALPLPVSFSTNIRSINLPTLTMVNDNFVDREVYVAGFGVTLPSKTHLNL